MELIAKVSAAAVCACVLSLIIKKTNPELSMLLSLSVISVIVYAGLSAAEGATGIIKEIKTILDDCGEYILPAGKCAVIGIVTGNASRLCRDASQTSTASAVEFVGTMCAAAAAAPMITAALRLIGELV